MLECHSSNLGTLEVTLDVFHYRHHGEVIGNVSAHLGETNFRRPVYAMRIAELIFCLEMYVYLPLGSRGMQESLDPHLKV